MKRILLILLMIGGIAYGQCPVVTGVTVTNLTSTTGKVSYTAAAGATLYYWTIYQVGSVIPAAGNTTTSTTFNFTGLTKSTSYKVYVRTQCGGIFSATSDSASFSTLSDGATYTPLGAQGYQIKYLKVDSGFNLPLRDTTLLRGINQAGAQVYKPGAGVFVYTGSYWQGISSGNGTIIISDSTKGIDSITFNGYQECIYLHDSITPTCWQLNRFFDDVRLSDDSLWYKYYNAGTVVDSVPSAIKNVGAVWPLSYNGTDLTTSKPFNDSLYLSSLVLHGTSLYSKKLTGDSVLIGTITGSGGSGITKVGSPAFGLTRTNDSTYIVDTSVIASQARLSAMLALKLNITDTANMRSRLLAGTGISITGSYPNQTITGTDTTGLSNRINAKLNTVDTANIRFRPLAGTNVTLSGTYPNITIAALGGGGITSVTKVKDTLYTNGSTVVYVDPDYYGLIYNANSWSSTSDFTNNGSTVSVVSNKLQFTGGANTFTQSLDITAPTMLENWSITARSKVGTKSSTSYGFGVGIRSSNAGTAANAVAKFDQSTNAGSGYITLYSGSSNTLIATSSTALTFSVNDSIVLTVEKSGGDLIASAFNYTTKSAKVTVSYSYSLLDGSVTMNNNGRFAIYSFGGTCTVDSFSVFSKDLMNPDIMVVGDSKTQGYSANDYSKSWASLLRIKYPKLDISAGNSEKITDVLNRINEIYTLRPKQLLLAIGRNDIGSLSSVYNANYDTLVARLTAHGIKVIHLLPFWEVSFNVDSLKDHILATYSANDIIDTYTPCKLSVVGSIHPNYVGHQYIYQAILASGKLYGGNGTFKLSNKTVPYGYTDGSPTSSSGFLYNDQQYQIELGTKVRLGTNGAGGAALNLNGNDVGLVGGYTFLQYGSDLYIKSQGQYFFSNPGGSWTIDASNNSMFGGKMYIGSSSTVPTSTLQTGGSFAVGYVAKSANYTASILDNTIECTANTFTVTLPTAVGIAGRIYKVVNSGAGTITIATTSSQTFGNITSTPTTLSLAPVGAGAITGYEFTSNGATWIVTGKVKNE